MKSRSGVVVVLIVGFFLSLAVAQEGYDSTECGNNNCLEEDGPICYNGDCYQCNPDGTANGLCMCGANEYCAGDPNDDDNFGKCKGYEGDIIGRRCDPGVTLATIQRGRNDQLFCGKLIFNTENTVARVEWEGYCDQGKCRVCQQGDTKCNGYYCALGSFVYAPANEFSWSYLFINPVTFSTFWAWMWLYIFFPLACIGIFICKKVGIC